MMATINWGDLWKFAGVVPGKPERPAPPEMPVPPETTDLAALLAEMDAAFEAASDQYPGGRITRPLIAMRKLVAELARRAK